MQPDFVDQNRFLWVYFSIETVCAQKTDDDKRSAISNLPKDLPSIYIRALRRTLAAGNQDVASAMLLWAAIAKRPLSIMEMREAIAVRLRQTELRESQLITEVESMVGWCNSLLIIDEEDRIVQFAHYSIKDTLQNLNSILSERGFDLNIRERLAIFHISEERKAEVASQVCCTYLWFDAFDDHDALVSAPSRAKADLQPMNIAKNSLMATSNNALVLRSWSLLERYIRKRHTTQVIAEDQSQRRTQLEESGSLIHKLQNSHYFLAYASEFWLEHTTNLSTKDLVWGNFEALVTQNRTVAIKPGVTQKPCDPENIDTWMLDYACSNEHLGLLRLSRKVFFVDTIALELMKKPQSSFEMFLNECEVFSEHEFQILVREAVRYNKPEKLKRLLGPVRLLGQEFLGHRLLRYTAMTRSDKFHYDEKSFASNICINEVHKTMEMIREAPYTYEMRLITFLALVGHSTNSGPNICTFCTGYVGWTRQKEYGLGRRDKRMQHS